MAAAIERRTEDLATPRPRAGWVAVLFLLWRAAAYTRPDTRPIPMGRRIVHFLRCTADFSTFRKWFNEPVHSNLREAIRFRPCVVTRHLHPYLNSAWSTQRKLAAISGHYALLRGDLGFLRFAPSTSLALARIDDGIEIRLDKPGRFEHEGELTLNLYRDDLRLFSLAFTLGTIGTQRAAYAGGLQGLASPDALETYRAMTHQMHGLRPRDLLITAFQGLCCALEVDRILAINDRQRVCSNPYFPSSPLVFSSYDRAWLESGATAADDGFYDLDPHETQRAIKDIPSRKRALYRRRYQMIDDLFEQIAVSAKRARWSVD
jgi:uncharacterized protein VirK/YbjX